MYKEMLDKLMDVFTKKEDSNIGKLFQVVGSELELLKGNIVKISEWQDTDKAKGKVLDRKGSDFNQDRGNLTDPLYRILIKTKIKRELSSGDLNTIIETFAAITGVSTSEVYQDERWPAGVYLEIPIGELGEALIEDTKKAGDFTHSVLAAGVGLEILFEGTFEFDNLDDLFFSFSETSNIVTSEYEGFSNLDQEVGGAFYYGALIIADDKGFSGAEQEEGGFFGSYYDSMRKESA